MFFFTIPKLFLYDKKFNYYERKANSLYVRMTFIHKQITKMIARP